MQAESQLPADNRWVSQLHQLCDRCVSDIGVDAASIVIVTGRRGWVPGAATSPSASRLEEYSFEVGDGPCFEAIDTHLPVLAADLAAPAAVSRWPVWTAEAAPAGVRSVAALPIEAGAITAGVLGLYAASPWSPTADQLATARGVADAALLVLLDLAVAVRDPAVLDGGHSTDGPLLLRADVHQAAGMVMAQAGITIDEALTRLRARAFATRRPLVELASDVLARRVRFDDDTDSEQ